uniref:Uncharacterized protein n=1 Tax=Romanomermis culicivorax TaxID=13658 RepID=A0A915IUM7_ROMCU
MDHTLFSGVHPMALKSAPSNKKLSQWEDLSDSEDMDTMDQQSLCYAKHQFIQQKSAMLHISQSETEEEELNDEEKRFEIFILGDLSQEEEQKQKNQEQYAVVAL